MEKQEVLNIILKVKLKPTVVESYEVLVEVEKYVTDTEPFDYVKTMRFIESKMPRKLGGVYIQVAKALGYLKNELMTAKKRHKNLMKGKKN